MITPRPHTPPASTNRASTPRPKRPARPNPIITDFEPTRQRALLCLDAADEKKAEDVVALNLTGLCNFTDVFLLCTGNSPLQVRAICDHVISRMKDSGARSPIVDGLETQTWIVVDFGDIVVHIMTPEMREFYNLEGLWGDAPALTA